MVSGQSCEYVTYQCSVDVFSAALLYTHTILNHVIFSSVLPNVFHVQSSGILYYLYITLSVGKVTLEM